MASTRDKIKDRLKANLASKKNAREEQKKKLEEEKKKREEEARSKKGGRTRDSDEDLSDKSDKSDKDGSSPEPSPRRENKKHVSRNGDDSSDEEVPRKSAKPAQKKGLMIVMKMIEMKKEGKLKKI